MELHGNCDVVVVGSGNAASCAALSARESGAKVVMVEAAPYEARGGNTAYAGGNMRVVFHGIEDLLKIIGDLTDEEIRNTEFGTYTAEDFFDDMGRITQYRCDPELVEYAIQNSFDTLLWMRGKGVRFQASFGPQAFRAEGKTRFWGNMPCEAWGGGAGLIEALHRRAGQDGINILYETPAVGLLRKDDRITGVQVLHRGQMVDLHSKAVVLACGGFEANAEMRARYLGPNWDLAKVRGTRFNTGQGLRMALDAGARAHGHWSSAHATFWELNAPEFGDLVVRGAYQKHGYPFGIMINARGERFVDEGADFWTMTYASYGREILAQPGLFAWQVFDQRGIPLLRDPYRIRQVTKVKADTVEALASKLDGVDSECFLRTVYEYNHALPEDESPLDPSTKDGRSTRGLAVPKSNWARRIDKGPFEAYAVTTGITFTFGGIKITDKGQAEDTAGRPIPGLFAAGEMVGGLFYHNYPGGTGLTCGAVFGRAAGRNAATFAQSVPG